MTSGAVVVLIPALNEAATIEAVVSGCRAHPDVVRVIVVDDGSTDATARLAAAAGAHVIHHDRRHGKGVSLARGLAAALRERASLIITMDGDGQHRPQDLGRLLGEARRRCGAIVVGSRRADAAAAPRARRIANRLADFWISLASGQQIEDSQCGFRVYPEQVARQFLARPMPSGFAFESAALIDAARSGVTVRSVPIPAIYAIARASHFRPVGDLARIVCLVAARLLAGPVHASASKPATMALPSTSSVSPTISNR